MLRGTIRVGLITAVLAVRVSFSPILAASPAHTAKERSATPKSGWAEATAYCRGRIVAAGGRIGSLRGADGRPLTRYQLAGLVNHLYARLVREIHEAEVSWQSHPTALIQEFDPPYVRDSDSILRWLVEQMQNPTNLKGVSWSDVRHEQPKGEVPNFRDVPFGHQARGVVQCLAEQWVFQGFPDGTFRGERPATPAELAVVCVRLTHDIQRHLNGRCYLRKKVPAEIEGMAKP